MYKAIKANRVVDIPESKAESYLAEGYSIFDKAGNLVLAPKTIVAEKLAKEVEALISHMGDKNNPHVTTAAQVGAYTKSETDAKLNGKANTSGTYSGLTAGNSLKIGGKTFSMNMNGDDLEIWWQ